MALFKRRPEDEVENLGKLVSENAVNILKKLAGEATESRSKMIDNIVLFTGVAGGVGTSTLVANLAYLLSKKGISVLVLDLNILYPIQYNFFGIKQDIESNDLVSFLQGKCNLGSSIKNKNNIGVIYSNNRGMMDSILCEDSVDNFETMLGSLRELFDIVIIDCPAKVESKIINSAMYICNHIYFVWDEGISSFANADRLRRNMSTTGVDAYSKSSAILNKRTSIHYTTYPFEKLKLELDQVLPFDVNVIESGLRGEIFCQKGISREANSKEYYQGVKELSLTVLNRAGYLGG